MCFHTFTFSSSVLQKRAHKLHLPLSDMHWVFLAFIRLTQNYTFSFSCFGNANSLFWVFFRLESHLISDIQTILQMLQRQPTLGPPAYSTVTASPEYQRSAVKVQPVALSASHLFSHTDTQVWRLSSFKSLKFCLSIYVVWTLSH